MTKIRNSKYIAITQVITLHPFVIPIPLGGMLSQG
jgi:hypothetical protein